MRRQYSNAIFNETYPQFIPDTRDPDRNTETPAMTHLQLILGIAGVVLIVGVAGVIHRNRRLSRLSERNTLGIESTLRARTVWILIASSAVCCMATFGLIEIIGVGTDGVPMYWGTPIHDRK